MERVRTITRNALYEKVWSTPMQKLAVQFGFSDRGMAKLCARHQIPVPGRGYWARLQFGQKPTRTPLPKTTSGGGDVIRIIPHEKQPSQPTALVQEPLPVIEVSENGPITHSVVLRIDKSVLRGKKDERGLPLSKQSRVLPVNVTLESLPRALRILEALFVALDGAGYKMVWPSPYCVPLAVNVLDEKIGLSLSEIVQRKQHKPTQDEIRMQKIDYSPPPRWDYVRTGQLKFAVTSVEVPHIQHVCADGKRQKLESCVGEVFASFPATANAIKKYREDREEAARRQAEEEKRAEQRRRKEEEYNRKSEVISKNAEQWRQAKQMREFAAALKDGARSPAVGPTQKVAIFRILDWMERHANYVDPLTDIRYLIRAFDKPRWDWEY